MKVTIERYFITYDGKIVYMTNADSKYIGYASEAMAKKQIRPTTIKELDIERKERIKPFDDACINARNNIYKLAGVSKDMEYYKIPFRKRKEFENETEEGKTYNTCVSEYYKAVKSIDIELKKRFKVEKKNVIIKVNGDERD